jgi:hypothetical protein
MGPLYPSRDMTQKTLSDGHLFVSEQNSGDDMVHRLADLMKKMSTGQVRHSRLEVLGVMTSRTLLKINCRSGQVPRCSGSYNISVKVKKGDDLTRTLHTTKDECQVKRHKTKV